MWQQGSDDGSAPDMSRRSEAKAPTPFRYFNSSPEVIRFVVMMYVKYPLSLAERRGSAG